jgi:hypothetical protein
VIPQRYVLPEDEAWQFRKAQSVEPTLAKALRDLCERNGNVRTCYLLDGRRISSGDSKLIIAVSLFGQESDAMEHLVVEIRAVLRDFPSIAGNTLIISAKAFERDFAGSEHFLRLPTSESDVSASAREKKQAWWRIYR